MWKMCNLSTPLSKVSSIAYNISIYFKQIQPPNARDFVKNITTRVHY